MGHASLTNGLMGGVRLSSRVTYGIPLLLLLVMGMVIHYYYSDDLLNDKDNTSRSTSAKIEGEVIELPSPSHRGIVLEEAILKRRSIRSYSNEPLSIEEVSQLLWSAQGITDKRRGFRSCPSAGATYPLEIYVVVRRVSGLEVGVYKYLPERHALLLIDHGGKEEELFKASFFQEWVRDSPIVLVIAANYQRTTSVYGERGIRYVHMEAGHCSQNVYLQAVSLGLGTVAVGAFDDSEVKKALKIKEEPLYLMPVGRPSSSTRS